MNGRYLITNGSWFCALTDGNAVRKTTDCNEATSFSESEALAVLQRATKKLKGYGKIPEEEVRKIPTISEAKKIVPLTRPKPEAEKTAEEETEAVKKTARKPIGALARERTYSASEGRCRICGAFVPHGEFTVDHVVPLAKGGKNEDSNYQTACLACNQIKQDMSMSETVLKMTEIMLFQMKLNGFGKKKRKKFEKTARRLASEINRKELEGEG